MDTIKQLLPAQCILLAVSLAANSDIKALHQLTPTRPDVFDPTLVLQILLTYLPETLQPAKYTTYVNEVTTRLYLEQQEPFLIDCSHVQNLSDAQAQKQLRHLHLLPLNHPSIAESAIDDSTIRFLIHRAYRIDAEAGLLPTVTELLEPFFEKSKYLRDWYVSAVLPLTRLDFEYYPGEPSSMSLVDFEGLSESKGLATLLAKTERNEERGIVNEDTVGRDFRGMVGPWIQGASQRKRRKLTSPIEEVKQKVRGQQTGESAGNEKYTETLEDWEPVFRWILQHAINDLQVATYVIEGWDGPLDLDLGEYQKEWPSERRDDNLAKDLQNRYCRSAFASVYAAEQDDSEAIGLAYAVLCRLAKLLDFEPPPDLATSIDRLPQVERHSEDVQDASMHVLGRNALMEPNNPLTRPNLDAFSLLQLLVYSAYQFASLGQHISVVNVAKLRFWSDESDQLKMIQRILHGLVNGARKDEEQWASYRQIILWLFDWAIEANPGRSENGYGVFGKLSRDVLEQEILQALCKSGLHSLIKKTYIDVDATSPSLPLDQVEARIVAVILSYFDNASNGNKTRGGVKKASDLIIEFRTSFTQSLTFSRCNALIAAAHALSFYSLTLQHGIPLQPLQIRLIDDPISLIKKLLEQNPRSYTKLDDLIEIGRNMTVAHLIDPEDHAETMLYARPESESLRIRRAVHRVTGMAIEAALVEDDFETAYSYIVNRLTPPSTSTPSDDDDLSWRVAFEAGRHRPLPTTTLTNPASQIRRLEQRMDLLSQSLLLAPPTSLPEILASWRRCEEELLSLLAKENAAEAAFDERAERREILPPASVPGGFGDFGVEEGQLSVQPRRKEMGRGAAEEAPMGLFDVARGAARAFGRTAAVGLRQSSSEGGVPGGGPISRLSGEMPREQQTEQRNQTAMGTGEDGRVRKRDMVANVVTGGLASGLGWVLGATPVHQQQV